MLLDKETNPEIIYLLANVNGDIIYHSDGSFYDVRRICADGIGSIIDSDTFLKISMRGHFTGFISTVIKGYSRGMISTQGSGMSKRFEIILFRDSELYRYSSIQVSLESILSIEAAEERAEISILEQIRSAEKELTDVYKIKGVSIDTEIKECDTAFMEPYFSKIIIACIMYMLSSVNGRGDISACASDTEYGKKITFSTDSEGFKTVKGIYDFCVEYPSASAVSACVRALCNKKGVELIIDCVNGRTAISAVFPKSEIKEFSVYNNFLSFDTKNLSVGK